MVGIDNTNVVYMAMQLITVAKLHANPTRPFISEGRQWWRFVPISPSFEPGGIADANSTPLKCDCAITLQCIAGEQHTHAVTHTGFPLRTLQHGLTIGRLRSHDT